MNNATRKSNAARPGGRLIVFILCLSAVAACWAWPSSTATGGEPLGAALALQEAVLKAKEKVLPAVVNIQPVSEVYVGGAKRTVTAIGSGVIYSPRGYVITNYHVAGKAQRLICTLFTKERVPAKLVGGDPYTDLAVIQLDLDKLKGNTLTWATLGDSDALQTGEFVLALGSPLALSHSLSVGVVSAKERFFPDAMFTGGETTGGYNTWIQTDAAINPGNSGGPLVNLRGEVIGINARKSAAGENLGFAIPINVVRSVADELVRSGKVTRSWLGLSFQPMSDVGESLGGTAAPKGVLVSGVDPGSPAEKAGVRAGDVLTRFDGRPVDAQFDEDVPPIRWQMAQAPVGRRVPLVLRRGGRTFTVYAVTEELGRAAGADFECQAWGFTIEGLTAETVRRLRLLDAAGVLVTGVKKDTVAAKAGVEPGDVVIEVDRAATDTLTAFREQYDRRTAAKPERVLLKVRRGAAVLYRLLKFETAASAPAAPTESQPATRPAAADEP
jgi:serine protease Do